MGSQYRADLDGPARGEEIRFKYTAWRYEREDAAGGTMVTFRPISRQEASASLSTTFSKRIVSLEPVGEPR